MTRRLVVSYLVVTVIVLVLLEIPLGIVYQQREEDQLTNDVERDATVLASLYEDALENGQTPDPQTAVEYTLRTGGRVVITDADGISVVDTAPDIATNRDFSTRGEIAAALAGDRASGRRRSETLDTELLYVAVPVASGGNVWGATRITLDAHEVNERVTRFWLGLGAVALVVVVAMTAIGWAVARSVTRPIRRLQTAANRFARGELSATEADDNAPPELRELEAALNTMAGRLDTMLQQQRSFVADASHQLRTPLTAIRLRLENLYSTTEDDAARGDIEASIAETTRLAALVDDLLKLARAERQPQQVVANLTAAVGERVDVWTAVAEEARVDLALEAAPGPLHVTSVAGGVEQILDNVLDNAITASPTGGTVAVAVTSGDTAHTVTIIDTGPGLDTIEKQRAFDRFWRGRTDTGGTGLGLAIVKTLAESSGGTVSLADNIPHGLVVTIELPVVADRSLASTA